MHAKNAKKASSKLQKLQTTLSRNCCSKNAPKLQWCAYQNQNDPIYEVIDLFLTCTVENIALNMYGDLMFLSFKLIF